MDAVKKDIINILSAYIDRDYSFSIESDLSEILNCSNSLSISPIIGYVLNKNNKYKQIYRERKKILSVFYLKNC